MKLDYIHMIFEVISYCYFLTRELLKWKQYFNIECWRLYVFEKGWLVY